MTTATTSTTSAPTEPVGRVRIRGGLLTATQSNPTTESITYRLRSSDGMLGARPTRGTESIRMRTVAERGHAVWVAAGKPERFEAEF